MRNILEFQKIILQHAQQIIKDLLEISVTYLKCAKKN